MRKLILLLIPAVLVFLGSCSNYSFTGAALSPEIETISFGNFPNRADQGSPQLSENFKRQLEDKFLSGTNLALVDDNGDISFEGAITRYNVSPQAVGQERATQNRLTIAVRVKFTNIHDEDKSFEETFSQFEDFDANQSLSAVEERLVEEIFSKIAEDVFNRAVIDW